MAKQYLIKLDTGEVAVVNDYTIVTIEQLQAQQANAEATATEIADAVTQYQSLASS